MDWAGPVLAQPQGWTQPSRVGWADVLAHRRKKKPWLVTMHEHSNQLINYFFLHAERAQCTFCKQEDD
jgi:hypothetical protein